VPTHLEGTIVPTADEKVQVGGGEDPSELRSDGKRSKSETKLKGPAPVMIEVLGEQINARDVVRRCAEMALLGRLVTQTNDPQTQFRLRVHLKAPAYGIPWKPKNDAMLLLGVYRHGFGNWGRIAADSDLQLDGKMNLDATELNKGAPDQTKLTRRVNALLRELRSEEKLASAKKSKKKGSKASKMPKVGGSNGHNSAKRQRHDEVTGDSPKKRARVKDKSSGPWYTDKTRKTIMTDALLATQRETLRDLRRLSREDARISNKELIERMKICLLHLGAQIVKLAQKRERVHNELWEYVHLICHTKHPGERLGALYDKLAETERRRNEIGNGSR
jgi:chromodomain-helicase-DNA-binding protein 1